VTIRSKPKSRPPVPKRCDRCGERMGTSPLGFMSATGEPLAPDERVGWLCDPCRQDVHRESSDN
jgi:hypothetical protein